MIWTRLKSLCSFLDGVFEQMLSVLIILGGSLLTLTVVLQVLLRYVFKHPLFGLEEFSRLVGIWVYFIGAIFGTKLDSHVQGDVAERVFSGARARAAVKVIVWVLGLVACLVFLYFATKYSLWLYGTGERTTGLWWPRITSVASMFFGALFMTIYSLANVFKSLRTALKAT